MEVMSICGALAAGEFAASFVPNFAEAWPLAAMLAALVAFFGYGAGVRGWPVAATFLLGSSLFLHASVESERLYLEKPWLRGTHRHERQRTPAGCELADEIKVDLSRRVGIGLEHDREALALNRAILLGERSWLPRQTKRALVASGTMHVFAISGLHVMAVAGVLVFLLATTFVPQRLAGVMSIPILWGYVCLIGCTPSAVRAALMASLCMLAPAFWRRSNLLRAWELTFMAVHSLNPAMITNVGNALSFAVMLAIALVVEAERRRGVRIPFVWITVIVWAAGAPISAHVFGQLAPGGILANLVLVAAAECTVVSGAVGILFSFVSEHVAAHFNNLSALCTRAMVGIAEAVAKLPGSNFEVPCWTILQCAEWYALLALVVFLVLIRRGRDLI